MPAADRIMQGENRKVGYEHKNGIEDEQLKQLQDVVAHINIQYI